MFTFFAGFRESPVRPDAPLVTLYLGGRSYGFPRGRTRGDGLFAALGVSGRGPSGRAWFVGVWPPGTYRESDGCMAIPSTARRFTH